MALEELEWDIFLTELFPAMEEALNDFVENDPDFEIRNVVIKINIYDGDARVALLLNIDDDDEEELFVTDELETLWSPFADALSEAIESPEDETEYAGEIEPIARFLVAAWDLLDELLSSDVGQYLSEEMDAKFLLFDEVNGLQTQEHIEKIRYELGASQL